MNKSWILNDNNYRLDKLSIVFNIKIKKHTIAFTRFDPCDLFLFPKLH